MTLDLDRIVVDFANAIERIDHSRPVWASARTGRSYQPGIGPHPETEVVKMVAGTLADIKPERYSPFALGMPYPSALRQKCDWVIGSNPDWAVEVKMLRLMGDNGKPNDNMLMHILSPYPDHRSALTDVGKMAASGFECRTAVLIYGFDYPNLPMEPAISAFETLALESESLSQRHEAAFGELVHPVHVAGRVVAWEVRSRPLGG